MSQTPKKKAPAKPKLAEDDDRRRDRRSPISRIEREVDKVTKKLLGRKQARRTAKD